MDLKVENFPKGSLKRRGPTVAVNISQIRSISSYSDLTQPPSQISTHIELTSGAVLVTSEPYAEVTTRIQGMRTAHGIYALIEITLANALAM